VQECKKAGVNFISPEHILLALLNTRDAGGRRLFERQAACDMRAVSCQSASHRLCFFRSASVMLVADAL
jgi:hypothetical protein